VLSKDDLFVFSQYFTPQKLLSRSAGWLADCHVPAVREPITRWFVTHFGVNLTEAQIEDIGQFKSFNDFFTRALKPDARPIDAAPEALVSPVDGTISQLGRIDHDQIFQAKGHAYSVSDLLGGDPARARPFIGGDFATIYLSPKDYHRIHMPITGTLKEMVHVPGKLFSVNPATADRVPRLFARNERVVCIFETNIGPMALVLVGAMIVASIETVWAGLVAPVRRSVQVTRYTDTPPITIEKGAEMGRFKLGSTVVMCFPEGASRFEPGLDAQSPVRMGARFGEVLNEK
jgi:phosphatidylserine decarboxylase